MKDAILVRVRGKNIFVQNLTNVVKLGLPMEGRGALETLKWFLQEIQKDLKTLRETQRARAPPPAPSADPRLDELVDGIMERLLTHPRCHKALWLPSRSCFRLKKKDVPGKAGQRDFFVRKGPRFFACLQQAGDFALDFLDRPDPDELGTEPGAEPGA